jgi:hypothetical protein
MAWLDALLGALFDNGTELEILGGLNLKGFNIALNEVVNSRGETVQVYDIEVDTSGLDFTSDDIGNESGVLGANVSEALDALATEIDAFSYTPSDNSLALAKLVNASAQFQIIGRKTASGGAWESCSRSELGLALSGTTITAGTNLTGGGDLSANRTLALVATLTGITSINGSVVAAPVQGTAITTTATITVAGGNNYDVTAAGGAYAITLGTTSAIVGEIITLRTTNALANAVTVTNGGAGGGNIGPASGTMQASVKGVYDFRFDGTNWVYVGCKHCS